MLVKNIMQSVKIHTISENSTVWEAAVKMAELNIGALIVGNPEKIEGLFSERDILKKVLGMGLLVESTKIRDVMSTDITVVEYTEMAYIALKIMQEKKFRHLPVVNEKNVCVGMLGIRDLMKSISETLEKENKGLARYLVEDRNLELNMGNVKDLMHKRLHLISGDTSVKQAVSIMRKFDIGSILIGSTNRLEGIFSERDLMLKVVVPKLSIESTTIKEVMTKKILTVEKTESVETVLTKMEKNKIRHLPVVSKDGICVGMLGMRDLMAAMLNKLETENNIMLGYLLAVSRVAIVITDIGNEKGSEDGNKIVINHKLSKNEFEVLTDTSKKTLNKVLANFQDEGLISVAKNKIVILDKPKLLMKII